MQQQCETPRCSSAKTTMMPGVAVRFRSTLEAKELQLQRENTCWWVCFQAS